MPAVLVFEDNAVYVDVAQNLFAADAREVCLCRQTDSGSSSLVNVQGMQICVSEICIELIQSVLCL